MSSTARSPYLPEHPQAEGRWDASLGGTHLHFGRGQRQILAELVRELGGRRPLLVTDPGVRATGEVDAAAEQLRAAGMRPSIFDAVDENPTCAHVAAGVHEARASEADVIVGFGGGSAMDTGKGINFLLTNGGRMQDYEGYGKATSPMLPSIAVPTTAGTGSEAQSFALIARDDDHGKMACGDEKARFAQVVLDPELLRTLPTDVAHASGIDALSHAVESHVSKRANPVSRIFSREAWKLMTGSLAKFLADPSDPSAAGDMLLGAHLAGAAIERSMLGAAHAGANPLTARFEIVHGLAVGLLLPHVVRFNRQVADADYDDLTGMSAGADAVLTDLLRLWETGAEPARLRDHGVEQSALPELATDAAAQWTAGFNPRPAGTEQMLEIYEAAY